MRHDRLVRWLVVSMAIVLGLAGPAQAIVIQFEAVDLPDGPQGDRWQYLYAVGDMLFAADQGFTVDFAVGLYQDLEDPAPGVNADWDVLTFQPDPAIPHAGAYDALALVDAASLADTFAVSFIWLGTGLPGSQPFTVNQFDAAGNFVARLDREVTVPRAVPVSAPAALGLVVLGSGGLVLVGRRPGR